jgi:putative copper resistance protein D
MEVASACILFGAPLFILVCVRASVPAEVGGFWPRWALPLAAVVLVLSALLAVMLQTAAITDDASKFTDLAAIRTVLTDTAFGRGTEARLFFAAVAYAVALAPPGRIGSALGSVFGAGTIASFAWTGHGAMDEGMRGWIHLTIDSLHLLAAGAWIGALVVLCAMLLTRSDRAVLHRALSRFSGLGTLAVGGLIVSGLVNAWLLIGPAQGLAAIGADYGRLLIAKLGLFVAMVVLASANRLVLAPRLGRTAARTRALMLSVGAETLLGLGVLAIVSVMGGLSPPMPAG